MRLASLLTTLLLAATAAQALPRHPPRHIVVVIMENRAAAQIIGAPDTPYINRLARQGASFTQSYAVGHPSEPNYLALFTGSMQGVTDDRCPIALAGPTLASQLRAAGRRFIGYAEDQPRAGYTGCRSGAYVRKHVPWANYAALPAAVSQPWSAFPQGDFKRLPDVSIVIPNLDDDMHDGSAAQGDAWLRSHIDGYVRWAATHDALLILTWDEDDSRHGNRIATILVGPMVKPGLYDQRIDHYSVLRTIEAIYGLPYLGAAAQAQPLAGLR
ncbi:MAG: hypothetical protein KGL18_04420 [Burkholderiales bacterium]|nr:alkaline phosphatase family protein [Burkholderiales bacterium]MDE1927781.1 hypothetical protein [Burkholderiales bacterium]MDE2159524.1 hypothetical protein [Burkholderiales bacterium]MDE2502212.1 hypothetical protein [Burkholderiales bacterium]